MGEPFLKPIQKGNKTIHPKRRGVDTAWDIPINQLEGLQLDILDQTWSYAPPLSTPIVQRFINVDDDSIDEPNMRKDPFVKYNYRNVDGYHILDTVPVDNIKPDRAHRKVEYRYNKDWFRSDHFKKEHEGLHIVFSGCSNTEGIGQNIEDTWSYMLYQQISQQHKTSGYFNLGRSGTGWQKIVNNFRNYVNLYGAPDYLFLIHPNLLRGYRWVNKGPHQFIGWELYQLNPWQEQVNRVEDIEFHRNAFPVWVMTWKLFTDYCESIGTKIVWSTWDQWENNNIINSNLFNDNFLMMTEPSQEDLMTKYYDLLDREDAIEARDGHDGYIHHTHWYLAFKERLIKDGLLND